MKKVYKTPLNRRKNAKDWCLREPKKRKETNRNANRRWYLNNKEKARKISLRWIKENPAKYKIQKRRSTVRKYNLTLEQFEEMVIAQKGKCAICKKPFPTNKAPAVDHNQKCCSGKITCGKCTRGLLCQFCNHGLGSFRDSIKILKAAIIYLGGSL